ncbi:hypothetical protein HMPREF0204_12406 [Chryseobacterium gleum ATCC 35910]|uniref:Uncharacterized protein n=1 Tax=Chryseobacterium gleum ATCC 35910 TaxID=525257 RepID=A0ABN0AK21_CHRGE|nr:hypothetical protein HMPREF0204_12406 [Chryseobacterium gleum ATCC 35910]
MFRRLFFSLFPGIIKICRFQCERVFILKKLKQQYEQLFLQQMTQIYTDVC